MRPRWCLTSRCQRCYVLRGDGLILAGGWRRRPSVALVAALAAALAVAAAASAAPQTGSFKATGAIRFAFTITKGRCDGAPNNSSPTPTLAQAKLRRASASAPPRLRRSTSAASLARWPQSTRSAVCGCRSSGTLHVRAYSYYGEHPCRVHRARPQGPRRQREWVCARQLGGCRGIAILRDGRARLHGQAQLRAGGQPGWLLIMTGRSTVASGSAASLTSANRLTVRRDASLVVARRARSARNSRPLVPVDHSRAAKS